MSTDSPAAITAAEATPPVIPDPIATPESQTPTPDVKDAAKPTVAVAAEPLIPDDPDAKPEEKPEAKPDAPNGAIEIALPEGYQVDEPAMAQFKELAGTAKLSNEQSQALFDMYVAQQTAQQTKAWNDWQAQQQTWRDEIKSDKEMGGDKLAPNMAAISKTINVLADGDKAFGQQVRDALKFTGAGNHPAIVRLLHRAATQLTEGRTLPAGNPTPQPKNPANVLYPDAVKLGNANS